MFGTFRYEKLPSSTPYDIPILDCQSLISPYDGSIMTTRQVTRIMKIIRKVVTALSIEKKCMASSEERAGVSCTFSGGGQHVFTGGQN